MFTLLRRTFMPESFYYLKNMRQSTNEGEDTDEQHEHLLGPQPATPAGQTVWQAADKVTNKSKLEKYV